MERINKYIGLILLAATCIIGLLNFPSYGIAWDEDYQHSTGMVNYQYVFNGDKELLTWKDRDYGVAFELPLIIVEKAFQLTDSRTVYLSRHLLTHLFFLTGAFFCFLLIDLLYKNKWLAATGFLLLVLCPRIYAHSFFNTKDIPFVSMFIICFYLGAKAFMKKDMKHFIVLGIAAGLLVNLRIMGVLFIFSTLLFFLLDHFAKTNTPEDKVKNGKLAMIFLITSLLTTYISWPFLWTNPIGNFMFAFHNMSKFRWDGLVLFNGLFLRSVEISWLYIPVWFCITIPVFFLLAGFSGIVLLIIHFIKSPALFLHNSPQRNNLLYLICFFSPVLAVIVLKSTVYDDWRQMYFIYPSFVLLAVYGVSLLLSTKFKNAALASLVLIFSFLSYQMIKDNPFQQVYFNLLVDSSTPEHIKTQFEYDYWGASYKQSLEHILAEDKSEEIPVAVANYPGTLNLGILPPEERKRIRITEMKEAAYFVTNYRGCPKCYEDMENKKWYSIIVNNNAVTTVFKLK